MGDFHEFYGSNGCFSWDDAMSEPKTVRAKKFLAKKPQKIKVLALAEDLDYNTCVKVMTKKELYIIQEDK